MSSLRNNDLKKQLNGEIFLLRKNFESLTIAHKKRVLKAARGLLKIQRNNRIMVVDNTSNADFSFRGKNG